MPNRCDVWGLPTEVCIAVGSLAVVVSFAQYAGSLPVALDVLQRADSRYRVEPYVAQWCSCLCGVVYALHMDAWTYRESLTAGAIGLVCSSFTLTVFLRVFPWLRFAVMMTLLAMASLAALSTQFTFVAAYWGPICVFFNIAMFVAPALAFGEAWRTRDRDLIPLSLGVQSFIGSVPWLLYGLLLRDSVLILPNAVGTVLSVAQFGLYAYLFHWLGEDTEPLLPGRYSGSEKSKGVSRSISEPAGGMA